MKVLIIEDEFNLADAIASMLSSQKYDVDIRTMRNVVLMMH
jgi:DNA-binding response OmpR family regulator